jgi:predicted Zn-dependent peptidase
MSDIQRFKLDNGLRILVEPVSHVRSAAIGLWIATGSRHEASGEYGVSHLIEHMLFKGTESRSAKEIAEAIEGRGGILNAFTDKEATCLYCRVLSDDVETGVDVLCDMILNSLLEPAELRREKGVVLEEIHRSADEPADHVHDLHLEERWPLHPLGRPVIGTSKSVKALKRENLVGYIQRRYTGPNLLAAVAGRVDPEAFREMVAAKLGSIPGDSESTEASRPEGKSTDRYHEKDIEQVHFCIGSDGCSVYDEDIHALAVMDAALGGGMSSRLFQEIREKRGLAYAVGSYATSFGEGGTFTVYGGTNPKNWPLVQQLVRAEFDKVAKRGLAPEELGRTKRLLRGNMVLALEGMSGRMMRMSRNELYHGREIPLEETLAKIERVSNDDVIRLARNLLAPSKIGVTAIGPVPSEP